MKRMYYFLLLILLSSSAAFAQENLRLWYDRPATNWNEALPLGNGRIGAMVFGDPARETFQLNEETVWAGSPYNNLNPEALDHLHEIRQLIFEKKFLQAQELATKYIVSTTAHGMSYQPVGNLNIDFESHNVYGNYHRELDLTDATTTVRYTVDGVTYTRKTFISWPDQVLVTRISADRPESISFLANFDSPQEHSCRTEDKQTIVLRGVSSDQEGIEGAVEFSAFARVINEGGNVGTSGSRLRVRHADAVTILVSIRTNFRDYKTLGLDPERACNELNRAAEKSYDELYRDHKAEYAAYFDRVSLDLGTTPATNKPTDERIRDFAESDDPQLVSLYFQFGRYLLISSSRPGTQPANLQGIWNHHMEAPWDSKYTININTEMNYWPAEVTNLSEMHDPLFGLIRDAGVTGREAAEKMYGARGWLLHHNTDLWRISGAVDRGFYGTWPMGGAWLSTHLWQRYLYTGDKQFLADHFYLFKGLSEFYLDFLVQDPESGWLVVTPSISPENIQAAFGEEASSLTAGATMDNQLVLDVFDMTERAAKELGLTTDKELLQDIRRARAKLPPMQVGRLGQLQEWMWDIDREDDKHRHVSHLYGMFPSNQISPYRNPELFHAVRKSLEFRGDVSTGWSMGWKVCLWARLLDGNHAYKLITDQLNLTQATGTAEGGGTYANMLDAHPPFQIDGNFGCAAGIAEMLVQSHDGAIHLLPALPESWTAGKVTGLKTRGGFEIDMEWEQGKVTRLTVRSALGGNCRLRLHSPLQSDGSVSLTRARRDNPNPYFAVPEIKKPLVSSQAPAFRLDLKPIQEVEFDTEAGGTYLLSTNG